VTRHRFVEATPPIWTACALEHTHDPDRPRTATHGLLCTGHYLNLEQQIAELPALATDTERALVRHGQAGGPKVTGSPERPLPFDEAAGDALRAARDVLASWCRLILDEHPSALHAPALAFPALAAFLSTHLEWIAAQPWIDDLCAEFSDARRGLRSALTTARTRVVTLGSCELPLYCDVTSHEVTCCAGMLRGFASTIDQGEDVRPIVCSSCGTEHQPADWRALSRRLRKDAEPMLTYAQLSQLLRVPIGTLKRWAHEDDWRRLDGRPSRYHHDDAQRSYDARRLEETA